MTGPAIVHETGEWALLLKPHGMPTAPLAEGEQGTLLEWYLGQRPEARAVNGKKAVEHGLLHRLDTGTEGLVLVARSQAAWAALHASQQAGLIRKTYFAFCTPLMGKTLPARDQLPLSIKSRFRPFGPKGREVRPLFPQMRGYEEAKTDYETVVEKAGMNGETGLAEIVCSLTKGYRHQVRAHLAWLGFPIAGDPLYGTQGRSQTGVPDLIVSPDQAQSHDLGRACLPLQLYAPGISFPDPASGRTAAFSLPLPDRTSR